MLPGRRQNLALHALRVTSLLAILASSPRVEIAIAVSAALFFACFAIAHDASHNALGLSRRANTVLLSATGLLMLLSGHAMRRMHLRHHARPLTDGDLEGRGARQSALRSLLSGPANGLALRIAAFRGARRYERTVQLLETLGGGAILGLAAATRWAPLTTFVLVAIALQLSMAFWASHLAHHAPAWLVEICKRFAFLRSPVLLSLAFHELHHAHPATPCQDLSGGHRQA